MNIKLSVFMLAATIFALSSPVTAQAKEHSEKSVAAIKAPKIADFVADAKQRIETCNSEYGKFRSELFASNMLWEASYNAAEASARLNGGGVEAPTMSETKPYHKICAESSKNEFIPTAKIFIKSFKNVDKQKATKDMVAQWITAIDTIGSDAATTEYAKFETLANGLILE